MTYVTAGPTAKPTRIPSDLPTSTMPSDAPSITGSVVFVEMMTEVTSTLTEDDIAVIVSTTESVFEVYPENVEVEVSYDVYGTVTLAFSDVDYSGEDVISAVESAIASTLGIHSSDVEITSYDSATGVAAYSVGSDSVEAAQEIQSLLQTTDVSKSMENEISTTIPGIKSVNTTFYVSKVCCLA